MESDLQHHHHFLLDKRINSGLTRYQSAPSSYISSFLERDAFEDFLNRPSSPETEQIFARLLSNAAVNTESNNSIPELLQFQQQQSYYQTPPPQQPQPQPQLFSQQMKMSGGAGGGNNSNLIRHSSSPAGLFNNVTIESGCVVMKGMGDYGGENKTIKREASSYASSGRPPTASKPMSRITEIKNKTGNAGFNDSYSTGFPMDSWDDSAMMSENINRLAEDDRTLSGLSAAETQNIDPRTRSPLLAHHLSLPKDISTIEKLLQYQDSVPCKIRAKRGCATHPRSIAERVRRTKISERMRKLQVLVPNMDKQTNTADMLDLAVDYVKELQKQVKALSDNRAKCTCANAKPEQP